MSASFTERDITDDESVQEAPLRINTLHSATANDHKISSSVSPYLPSREKWDPILPESPSYSEIQKRITTLERTRSALASQSPSNKENNSAPNTADFKKDGGAFGKLFNNPVGKLKVKVKIISLLNSFLIYF